MKQPFLDDWSALEAELFLRAIIYWRTDPPRHKWRLLLARTYHLKKKALDELNQKPPK